MTQVIDYKYFTGSPKNGIDATSYFQGIGTGDATARDEVPRICWRDAATPSDHAWGEELRICSALFAPIVVRSSVCSASSLIADSRPRTSFAATSSPFQFSRIKSAAHPAARLTITGRPQAMASLTTIPQVSVYVGSTSASASP